MSLDNEFLSDDAATTDAAPVEETSVAPEAPAAFEAVPSGDTSEAADDFEAQLAMKNLEKRRAEKRRKRIFKIVAALAVVAAIVAIVVFRNMQGGGEEEGEEYVPETVVVERSDFSNEITTSGALKAGSTEYVTPEVDGIIESVSVAEGDTVSKGDVLFTIKNEELDKAVREAEQEVESAQQGVSSAQSAVTQAIDAREKAWDQYYTAYGAADTAHREWANLKKNYTKLHAQWQKKYKAAQKLKVAEPTIEPLAPVEPAAQPDPENPGSYVVDSAAWNRYMDDYNTYQKEYTKYLKDVEAWRKYQDALAKAGEEPEPAGEEPEYPEKPDDTELQAAIQDAEEGVTSASQAVTKAQEAYDEAVAAAEKRIVKAPSGGSVVSMTAKVGASTLGSGAEGMGGDALVQISDMRKMAVDVDVNEIDILSIEKGQKATVTFSAIPDIESEATVREVSTLANGEGGGEGGGIVNFHVGLVIDKPDKRLRAGMTANVNIITADATDVLVVPSSALSEGADGFSVEVVTDEETMETETRPVKIGERSASEVVITDGLQEGEVILLSGGFDEFDEEF